MYLQASDEPASLKKDETQNGKKEDAKETNGEAKKVDASAEKAANAKVKENFSKIFISHDS